MVFLHPLQEQMGIVDIENNNTTCWSTGNPGTVGAEMRSIKRSLFVAPLGPTFFNRGLVLLCRFGQTGTMEGEKERAVKLLPVLEVA